MRLQHTTQKIASCWFELVSACLSIKSIRGNIPKSGQEHRLPVQAIRDLGTGSALWQFTRSFGCRPGERRVFTPGVVAHPNRNITFCPKNLERQVRQQRTPTKESGNCCQILGTTQNCGFACLVLAYTHGRGGTLQKKHTPLQKQCAPCGSFPSPSHLHWLLHGGRLSRQVGPKPPGHHVGNRREAFAEAQALAENSPQFLRHRIRRRITDSCKRSSNPKTRAKVMFKPGKCLYKSNT